MTLNGWDNSRKNQHEKIKTPYYYNFFIKPTTSSKGYILNDAASERFVTIEFLQANLFADEGTNNIYYIEKLFCLV